MVESTIYESTLYTHKYESESNINLIYFIYITSFDIDLCKDLK